MYTSSGPGEDVHSSTCLVNKTKTLHSSLFLVIKKKTSFFLGGGSVFHLHVHTFHFELHLCLPVPNHTPYLKIIKKKKKKKKG